MELLPFDEYVRSLDRKRTAAGVLLRDTADRVLFVRPSYQPFWEIPGGAGEAGEAPWHTAVRELREELGLDRPPGRLLVLDHQPAGRLPEGLNFVFDGGLVTEDDVARMRFTDDEIVAASLLPLADATPGLQPVLARRVAAALASVRSGDLLLCEDGRPVS
ncbi:NUDIX hydrolase [Amycolatopsis sp. NBC_00438]|uniref:NUDIX hydrolase n=1 Tax=Amycolatopsis sp. NBC_00438 TaxID=2903558 RepID=UPI002E23BEA1